MNKKLLLISILLISCAATILAQIQPVIISEVFYDTPLNEDMRTNSYNHHNGEFIELYNPTVENIDISGWWIKDNGPGFTFPQNTTIYSKGTVIIAFSMSETGFELKNLFSNIPANTQIFYQNVMWLQNDGEKITLINKQWNEVDEMSYCWKYGGSGTYWDIRAYNGKRTNNLKSIQRKQVHWTSSNIQSLKSDYFIGTPTPGSVYENLSMQTVENELYAVGEIDRNLPVGTLAGSSSVSPTGAAGYSIPIEVPAGTNGFQPNLSIAYNSQGGYGALGTGWDIGGLSSISRGLQNFYFDQTADGKIDATTIKFDNTDRLYIDGQRLILLDGNHFASGAVYATETENYARVTIATSSVTGKIYFIVTTKEGNTTEYGKTADALLKDGNKVMAWRINKATDVNNNEINYTYQDNGQYVNEIMYNNNTVAFYYINAAKPQKRCVNGFWIKQEKLLNRIAVTINGQTQNGYIMGYDVTENYAKLDAIYPVYGNQQCNPTKITWGAKGSIQEVDLGAMPDGNKNNVDNAFLYSGDIDGDGIQDKIEMWTGDEGSNQQGHIQVTLKAGDNTLPVVYFTAENKTRPDYNQLVIGDVNKDGKDEIMRITANNVQVYEFNPINNRLENNFTLTYSISNQNIRWMFNSSYSYKAFLSNANNDEYVDLLIIPYIKNIRGVSSYYISQPYSAQFFLGTENGLSTVAEEKIIRIEDLDGNYYEPLIGDFNADGKPDLLQINGTSTNNLPNVDIYESPYWQSAVIGFRSGWDSFAGSATRRFESAYPFDINNDGFTDVLFKQDGSLDYKWRLKINNGGVFTNPTDKILNLLTYSTYEKNNDERAYTLILDYNGDGYQDIIIIDDHYSQKKYDYSDWYFYKNTGGSFENDEHFRKYLTNDGRGQGISKMPPTVMDINNDGVPDLVFGDRQGNRYNNRRYKAFTMPDASKRNVVHAITNGLGQTEKFAYKYFNTYNQDETGNPADVRNLKAPLMVVEKHTAADGTITAYDYQNPKTHTKGRGFLGFQKITAENSRTRQKTVSEYEIDPTCYVSNLKKQTISVDGVNISETVNTNEIICNSNIAQGKNGEKRFIPVVGFQSATDKIRNFTATADYTFNNYGVVTKKETVSGSLTSVTEYFDLKKRTTSGLVAYLPQKMKVTNKRTGFPDYVFESEYTYDAKGNVDIATEMKGTYAQTVTDYDYFPTGNLKEVKVKPSDKTEWQTTKYQYDSNFRFATEKENVLGQKTYTSHDNFGRVTSETDIAGLITTYQYNALGQLIKKTLPTTEEISYALQWGAKGGTYWFKKTASSNKINNVTETHYDNLGRETYTETTGWKGTKLKSFTQYDPATGKVTRTVKPRYDGETELYTDYEYSDYLQRVTKEKTFDGATMLPTQYLYDDVHGKVTVIAPDNTQSFSQKNAMGEVELRHDNGGDITYTYNALGKPVLITAGGATTEIIYEELTGRQKELHDPNAGTITYEYFADGSLKKQTNANLDETEYTYDKAGRTLIKTVKDFEEGVVVNTTTTSYDYVEAGEGNGIGQIQSITLKENNSVIHTQSVSYNNRHLIASNTDSYDGKTFTFSYTYDNLWRPLTTTSPSGLVTTNEYNTYGDLIKVKKGITVIWEGIEQNSNGQFKQYKVNGGNVITTNTYNPRGELTDIQTKKGYTFIQNNHYEYNAQTGNLLVRNDLKYSRNESYTYDNLDRLKTATLNGATLFDINYYPNGNIQDKTDVGMYLYETEKPHAMSGIANVQSGVNQDVKQFIDYTPFHKISRIRQGADEFNITDQYNIYYGLDRQRIKTEQLHEGNILRTRYYIGTYEEENAGNAITKIDYIFTPTGLTAIQKGLMLYYVHTDRQGSIERITDIRGSIQTAYAYTAWGGRILLSGDSTITDRGYTGHEHLTAFQTADGFTLINMNGRVYDPVLARFLSPDPYVQAPDFTQSFNRYSYCLNNPFKYTDPTGEKWWHTLLFGIADSMLGGALSISAITTASSAAATVGTMAGTVSGIALTNGIMNSTLSFFGSLGSANYDIMKRMGNAWKLSWGMFKTDESLDFWGRTWQFMSRYSWEMPATAVGQAWHGLANAFSSGDVNVGYFHGATVLQADWMGYGGVTIGSNITIGYGYGGINADNVVLIHEYGHYLQLRDYGGIPWLYMSLSSLASAAISPGLHDYYWSEMDANARSAKYFNGKLTDMQLKNFNTYFPNQEFADSSFWQNYFQPYSTLNSFSTMGFILYLQILMSLSK
ncbi:hypothetical protein FACS189429_1950 [Bacteroidia bacterium]|nr:hypothetical protein FACS189429_1950 [Bacteroidia bacterium]